MTGQGQDDTCRGCGARCTPGSLDKGRVCWMCAQEMARRRAARAVASLPPVSPLEHHPVWGKLLREQREGMER